MKNYHRLFQSMLIVLFSFSCTEFSKELKDLSDEKYTKIKYSTDDKVKDLVKYLSDFSFSTSKTMGSFDPFNYINWDSGIRTLQNYGTSEVLCFKMEVSPLTKFSYEYFIMYDLDGRIGSYIEQYIPDRNWLVNLQDSEDFSKFTGTKRILYADGSLYHEFELENGVGSLNPPLGGTSGRVQCTLIETTTYNVTEVCSSVGCHESWEIASIHYEWIGCEGGGGAGGNPPPNPGIPEGPEPIITGGGPTSGESSGGVYIGQELPTIEVSYYLSAYTFGEDVNNPYDGMKAVDTDGIIYTYDASLGVWLLPSLNYFAESSDYTIQIEELTLYQTGFTGTTMPIIGTTIPLEGVIPAGTGTIILGGATIIIATVTFYYIWEFLDKAALEQKEYCISMYELCTTKFGYKNMSCGTCIQYCNTQGYWDHETCPLRP